MTDPDDYDTMQALAELAGCECPCCCSPLALDGFCEVCDDMDDVDPDPLYDDWIDEGGDE